MNVTQFKTALPFLMKTRTTTLLWGAHGLGKSGVIEQFAQENGYKLFNLRLGNMDTGDLLGLCDFVKNEKGESVATKFAMPDWLRNCIDYCNDNPKSHAIVFMDELNRARRDVLSSTFQMIYDYRLHTVEFPKNMYIIAASNPATDDYNVLDLQDKAFLDRWLHIKFQPSKQEFHEYANKMEFDGDVQGFLKEQPELLDSKTTDFSIDEMATPSRRSWEKVSILKKSGMPHDLLRECTFGLVGVTACVAFEAWIASQDKPFTAEEIITDYKKCKKKVKKQTTSGRQDMLNLTCKDIESWFKKNTELTQDQGNNIMSFFNDISGELCFTYARSLFLEAPALRPFLDADKKFLQRIKEVKKAKKAADETKEVKKAKKAADETKEVKKAKKAADETKEVKKAKKAADETKEVKKAKKAADETKVVVEEVKTAPEATKE